MQYLLILILLLIEINFARYKRQIVFQNVKTFHEVDQQFLIILNNYCNFYYYRFCIKHASRSVLPQPSTYRLNSHIIKFQHYLHPHNVHDLQENFVLSVF